ncbi:archaellin/type IV pilin N-terminal domain-containing protein [Natrarchaeobaculum sulfurireducens]|uniref:Flagellin n=1 Tax=Natrarchaeobaculum sulfurireducens TaxID=2044521 RepID=A0A346PGX0_9EURY|nr:archaellin/type IV pilin N-terminal domain-containing protein [Natrarchaeobaculum sulfurireducens]AXR78765.1 Archaeal flagellin [Natrarchaeobaculum sulfurireducens]
MFVDNNDDDRGQVGIGTLIVFIAMVLVAAIAAGVLINTAGFLQAQAEATGEESTELVSERIDATSTVGIVDSADDGELEEIRVGVTAAAGADDISLEETVVQVVGPEGQANLIYDEDAGDGVDDVDDLSDDQATFAAMDNSGDFIEPDDAVLDSDNGDYTLVFNPETDPFGDEDNSEVFGEGDEAALDIVSPASATTQVELRAPDLFNDDGEAVRL